MFTRLRASQISKKGNLLVAFIAVLSDKSHKKQIFFKPSNLKQHNRRGRFRQSLAESD